MPLTFFDIMWVHFHPIQRLLFYDYPFFEPNFSENLFPVLKRSLPLAFQDYLPLSGHLTTLLTRPMMMTRSPFFVTGDSFTTAVSGHDFDELIADHAQDADQFYEFVPEMSPSKDELDCKAISVVALKASLFPGRGKLMREIPLKARSFPLPTNKVRATFTLDRANTERLKDLVSAEKLSLGRVSSFVVPVSYVLACLAKSIGEIGEETDDDVVD
ncbi:HXXXD-type acyl-transferase family protein [Striga hermonthica]|uniref:HXXXD-type acyl-transferase family protein n=1 Tax=Striga hermonthica TaxID=68872 RepID=A0A9N7R399_STRHE|nr:HXXXD-type acyl-transferase family protein [Striga hermonthica]